MRGSRYWIVLLLTACAAAPVIIGASCPPPTTPVILGIVSDTTSVATVIPSCITGFLCVDIQNNAGIPVNVALYKQNGFDDPNNPKYPSGQNCACSTQGGTTQLACPCPCVGATDIPPNCKLNAQQLYDPVNGNVFAISGSLTPTFQIGQSALIRIRCPDDVKTLGLAASQTTVDVLTVPDDRASPVYRAPGFGSVQCGTTVQFLITDLNQTTGGANVGGSTATATIIIQTNFGG
jgi:hypothetical protein